MMSIQATSSEAATASKTTSRRRKMTHMPMVVVWLRNLPHSLMILNLVGTRSLFLHRFLDGYTPKLIMFTFSLLQFFDNLSMLLGRFPLRGWHVFVFLVGNTLKLFMLTCSSLLVFDKLSLFQGRFPLCG